MSKTIMAVKLEKEDYEFLKKFCEQNGSDISTFIRNILGKYIKELKKLESLNIPLQLFALDAAHYYAVSEDHRFTFVLLKRILARLGDQEGAQMADAAIAAIEKYQPQIKEGRDVLLKIAQGEL